MFNRETTIMRTYSGRAIDFAVLSELLNRFEQSLPSEAKLEGKDKLQAVQRFEISTFSQQVAIESSEQFTAFLAESSESPEKIQVRLECHRVPSGIGSYAVPPPYLEIS